MINSGVNRMQASQICVDENGDWYYMGNRIFRPEILELLYSRLDRLPTGEFILTDGEEICRLDVADTPFVIYRVDMERSDSGEEWLALRLRHSREAVRLDPETLWIGTGNVLYCRVADRRFPARFSRPAYYQFAEFVREEESGGSFYIELNGRRHVVKGEK